MNLLPMALFVAAQLMERSVEGPTSSTHPEFLLDSLMFRTLTLLGGLMNHFPLLLYCPFWMRALRELIVSKSLVFRFLAPSQPYGNEHEVGFGEVHWLAVAQSQPYENG